MSKENKVIVRLVYENIRGEGNLDLVDEPSPPTTSDTTLPPSLKWSMARAYLNFIGEEGQHRVVASFGPKPYARLQALKDRYGPDNLFHLNQNINPSRGTHVATPAQYTKRGGGW